VKIQDLDWSSTRKLNTDSFESFQTESRTMWTDLNNNVAEVKTTFSESLAGITENQSQVRETMQGPYTERI
jgi:hypothetical protein